ncbi:metal-binding protein [Pantanalinema rosaneae CENA516]|uniref:metal-binding protein n=1 Tax=Pantanalinema rosaneae TaxID=1620701 RepID=UPI003D6DC31D
MPSGRTHDRITLWSLPLIATVAFERTRSGSLTLLVAGGFLFSGLMFGPDLDIHSRQYLRWGWLRWIWLPYRRGMRHRSVWSHGPIVGTIVRVVYLGCWLLIFAGLAIVLSAIVCQLAGILEPWYDLIQQLIQWSEARIGQLFQHYSLEMLALMIGLELGALSHSVSDWSSSRYRRWQKRHHRKDQGNRSAAQPPTSHPVIELPTLPDSLPPDS